MTFADPERGHNPNRALSGTIPTARRAGARLYPHTHGRFMQADPIGYGSGMNMYGYVGGDPVNFVDPSGAAKWEWNCYGGGCGSPNNGYWNGGIGGLGTPVQRLEAAGWTQSGGGWVAPPNQNTGAHGCPGGGGGGDIVVCGSRAQLAAPIPPHVVGVIGHALFELFTIPEACCFTAGTLVETPSGLKTIETLKVGDLVISRSYETGETAAKPIVTITPAHERRIWTVTVSYKAEDGRWRDEKYETTDEHPWRTADGRWVPSASLKHGMVLARENGTAIVAAAADSGAKKLTYNLEIADFHTYFVGRSKEWVHNACKKMRVSGLSGKEAAKNVPSWAKGEFPNIGESGKDFATRILNNRYGPGNWSGTGPTSEFNILKKYSDRGFTD